MSDVFPRAEDMLIWLLEEDHKGAIWCCTLIGYTVLPFVPKEDEARARLVLRRTGRFSLGLLEDEDYFSEEAFYFEEKSARRSRSEDVRPYRHPQHMKARRVETAALGAVGDVCFGTFEAHEEQLWTTTFMRAVRLVSAKADYAAHGRGYSTFRTLLQEQIQPAEILAAESPLEDWLLEKGTKPDRKGKLSDAIARAWKNGLRWWVPGERALAERFEQIPEKWSRR